MTVKVGMAMMSVAAIVFLGAVYQFVIPAIRGVMIVPLSPREPTSYRQLSRPGESRHRPSSSSACRRPASFAGGSVDEGDKVDRGDVLFTLDENDARATVERAQAAVGLANQRQASAEWPAAGFSDTQLS